MNHISNFNEHTHIHFVPSFDSVSQIPPCERWLSRLKHFCAVVAEPFESKTNRLHIRFYANKATVNSSFTIYYSTFHKKIKGACEPNELDCEDDTCIISEGLKCNNRPNCKFQKDEEGCPQVSTNTHEFASVIYFADDEVEQQHIHHLAIELITTIFILALFRPHHRSRQTDEDKKNDLLFIIIVFSALLGAMTTVFFFNCIRKLIRDQKIIRVSDQK